MTLQQDSSKDFEINTQQVEKESLAERFKNERDAWTKKIAELSKSMKNVSDLPVLQTIIYTERQIALDYYHYLVSLIVILSREYRKQYNDKYDYYTTKSQIRYPNEATKNNRILTDLSEIFQKKEMLENHIKASDNYIKTLDNIIYGISKRVDIENIIRGR